MCEDNHVCTNMLKCKSYRKKCIQLGSICDGKEDCPNGNDELLCQLRGVSCPSGCNCLALAVECSRQFVFHKYIQHPFQFIQIRNVAKFELDFVVAGFKEYFILNVINTSVNNICGFNFSQMLLQLDLSENCASSLTKYCFYKLPHLKILDIKENEVSVLETNSFWDLPRLQILDLSSNPMKELKALCIGKVPLFKLLKLNKVKVQVVHSEALENLEIKHLQTTNYQTCCLAEEETECSESKPWFISCSNLLPSQSLKLFFICVSVSTIVLNVASLVSHVVLKMCAPAFAVNVLALNTSDMLCAVYLCTIWIAHLVFQANFVLKEELWRSGWVCHSAFGTVVWFSLLSQLVIHLLSLSRLMVVLYPIESAFKKATFVGKCSVAIFVASFCFSVVLTTIVGWTSEMLPFHLCLPFVDPTNSVLAIKIITWFSVTTQTFTSLAVTVEGITLVTNLSDSGEIIQKSKSRQSSELVLIIQLFVITVSNILCWFPANGIYVVAIFAETYPIDLIIWTTVVIMPLNSVVNPSVFLVLNLRKFYIEKKKDTKSKQGRNVNMVNM